MEGEWSGRGEIEREGGKMRKGGLRGFQRGARRGCAAGYQGGVSWRTHVLLGAAGYEADTRRLCGFAICFAVCEGAAQIMPENGRDIML